MERLYVLPQDVCNITGKKLRHAQSLLMNLKILLGKGKHQYINKKELATYLNVDETLIRLDNTDPILTRICIYPEDICKLTGKHLRTAQEILINIRQVLKKKKHQLVTKEELANYLGIDEELIKLY